MHLGESGLNRYLWENFNSENFREEKRERESKRRQVRRVSLDRVLISTENLQTSQPGLTCALHNASTEDAEIMSPLPVLRASEDEVARSKVALI